MIMECWLLMLLMYRYDALLAAGNSWQELCMRAVLHGGDNDSTGAIACAWFGALYAFTGVPECHYEVTFFHYCDLKLGLVVLMRNLYRSITYLLTYVRLGHC